MVSGQSKQTSIHAHMWNAVTLVWSSLRLTPSNCTSATCMWYRVNACCKVVYMRIVLIYFCTLAQSQSSSEKDYKHAYSLPLVPAQSLVYSCRLQYHSLLCHSIKPFHFQAHPVTHSQFLMEQIGSNIITIICTSAERVYACSNVLQDMSNVLSYLLVHSGTEPVQFPE